MDLKSRLLQHKWVAAAWNVCKDNRDTITYVAAGVVFVAHHIDAVAEQLALLSNRMAAEFTLLSSISPIMVREFVRAARWFGAGKPDEACSAAIVAMYAFSVF